MHPPKSTPPDEKQPDEKSLPADPMAALLVQRQNESFDVMTRLAGVGIRLLTHRAQAITDHVAALQHCANPVDFVTLTNQYLAGAAADYSCAGRQWALMIGREPPPCTLPLARPSDQSHHTSRK